MTSERKREEPKLIGLRLPRKAGTISDNGYAPLRLTADPNAAIFDLC